MDDILSDLGNRISSFVVKSSNTMIRNTDKYLSPERFSDKGRYHQATLQFVKKKVS